MKTILENIWKGFLIGLGKVIPGVSGSMIAISLGVYDKAIEAVSHFFKNIKKNILFLTSLGTGGLLAILLGSKVIKQALSYYYLPTMLLFIGLILGGLPAILKKVKSYDRKTSDILLLISLFLLVSLLSFLNPATTSSSLSIHSVYDVIMLLFVGMIDAATMVIPGISGTAILMLLGYYQPLLEILSNLDNTTLLLQNLKYLIPFGLGMIFGIILVVKIMSYLLEHYEKKTYYAILAFASSSILLLLFQTMKHNYSILELLISLLFMCVGYKLANYLDK